MVPLPADAVRRIADAVAPYPFQTLHDAFSGGERTDAKAVWMRSAERYVRAIERPDGLG